MIDTFKILAVCMGNICRSPLAEQLLAKELADLPPVQVSSAGTRAVVGHSMNEESQRIARELGVSNSERHQARQLTADMLTDADLVLALSREHRRYAVELRPSISRRVFTIREFGRLAVATTDDDLRSEFGDTPATLAQRLKIAAATVVLARNEVSLPDAPEDDDVVDPIGGGPEAFKRSTDQLLPAVEGTVSFLRRVSELNL